MIWTNKKIYQKPGFLSYRNNYGLLAFIPLISLMFLISCTSYSYIETEILQPAKYSFPPKLSKLVVVNRKSFDYTLHKANNLSEKYFTYGVFFNNFLQESDDRWNNKLKTADSIITDNYLGSLIENIKTEPRFELVQPDRSVSFRKNSNISSQNLNWEEVDNLTRIDSADGVLALENSYYFDELKISNSQYGGIKATLAIYIDANWTIYDKLEQTSTQIHIKDTSFIDISGNSYDEIIDKFPNSVDIFKECGINAGFDLIHNISPYWIQSERFYFTGPGIEMITAGKHAEHKNWKYAATIWKSIYNSGNSSQKSKAAFNMALACEMLGQLDLAWEWIMDVDIPLWNEDVIFYRKILQERINKERILDLQFGY